MYSFLVVLFLSGFSTICNAQEKTIDKTLSAHYEQEIKILDSEIKTLKIKLNSDKKNETLKSELAQKKEARSDLKKKKGTLDKAVKNQKSAEKALRKAEQAREKAEKASKEAQKIKEEHLAKGA